jgi:outer membrane receptor protein involved in Fe transport
MPGGSGRVRLVESFLAAPILCLAASPVAAADEASFNISAGRLSDALIALAEQAGLTIGLADPAIAGIRARALHGRMPVRTALARLLAGSGYRYEYMGPRAVRILRAAPERARPPAPPRPAPLPARPAPPAPAPMQREIIVIASKQGVALDRFGGTAHLLDLGNEETGRFGDRGSEAVLDRLPMLASTSLGPGRNKIYIRGVADSSFNGPSQSIVGQYLGDVRLTFNAPDPDLNLYDIARVEVLEGPQGTLYGTGSLGGILRLVPNPPDLVHRSGSFSAGLLSTRHGANGGDGAFMVNLPLDPGRLALRAVGYGSIDGGYIDDPGQGRRHVNQTRVYGGRASLLWAPGDGWRIEAGALAQYLAGRDGQYAMRGLPPLTRRSSLAQPFDNDYQLGQVTIRKSWSNIELVSATGIVRHSLESRFDATGLAGTIGRLIYIENVGITLITNETRISQPDARGEGWVAGWSLVHDIDRIRRTLGPPDAPLPIAGVRNAVSEAALFGQYSLALDSRVTLTLGGRLTLSRNVGEALDAPGEHAEPDRIDFRPSPTAAITWRPVDGLLLYARAQQGFRAGGLAVAGSGTGSATQRFDSDSLTSIEAGFRLGRTGAPFHLDAAFSFARWKDMQADLIDARGLPFTTNLGDGRIFGVEANGSWQVTPAFSLDAAAFINESALSRPDPAFASAQDRDLPNIPGAGARGGAHVRTALSPTLSLAVDAALRYVGRSHLGIGAPIDLIQGGFVDGQIGGRLDFGRFGLSLDVDNVADTRANRFSFGNPFSVAEGLQTTPLRPRTVRLGFDATF